MTRDMDQKGMLYVHIPFCVQKCKYCDFLSFQSTNEMRQIYVDALCKEITAWGQYDSCVISSVFIGGGTPSLLTIQQMEEILSALHRNFKIEKTTEVFKCCLIAINQRNDNMV